MKSAYRSQKMDGDRHVVGFSISHEKENLLARGLGLEHLQEMVIRLARTVLRNNHNLAYGGDWGERPENFTYLLLNMISAEQQDQQNDSENQQKIGRLYNHLAWPFYLAVTPEIEAKWIDSCQIARIDQDYAGIAPEQQLTDEEIYNSAGIPLLFDKSVPTEEKKHLLFNTAVCLSAMRRAMGEQIQIPIPDLNRKETIPPITGRIILGGKVSGYTGFLPGILEEALYSLKRKRPLYPLGGFGGCAELIAKAILSTDSKRPDEFTLDWHCEKTPALKTLVAAADEFPCPEKILSPKKAFDDLWRLIKRAKASPAEILNTGLSDKDTLEVLQTRDMDRIVKLLRSGLANQMGLDQLAG